MLARRQAQFTDAVMKTFESKGLTPHTVGAQDFTSRSPLRKVLDVLRQCDGACILGLVQVQARNATVKPGTKAETIVSTLVFPSPWNQLEAGMALVRDLPLLVICQEGVNGGIFDDGVGDVYVHRLRGGLSQRWLSSAEFQQSLDEWIGLMTRRGPRRGR